MGVGMAYAEKVLESPGRVFVILSDGELQEGSTWEACMMAPTLGLDNLVAFVDNNDFQTLGRTSQTHPNFYPLTDKLRAFGWEAECTNGHDVQSISHMVTNRKGDRPFMLVCETIKGRGVKYMENVPIWHYRAPDPEEYTRAVEELAEVCS